MNVNIICIGKLKEKYLREAVAEYAKRLSAFCKFTVYELDEERLGDNPSEAQIEKAVSAEGERILKKLTKGSYVVSMCIEGKMLSSHELAECISDVALNRSSSIDFIIGGSYGLSHRVKAQSDLRLSMSKMTFPHQLARVMLCEQIYRAFMINSNSKYHK